ncbi:acyltransferase family protein [Demequina iriomotensis]|uniref:acyltransferase family protein n=1 Tax=Demequina iriomotensis TaxID=1536641 RepID=UPI000784AFD1|nr:acyltransferase [Demequina iriomotensis]
MNVSMNALRILAAILVVVSHVRAMFFVDFVDAADQGLVAQTLYASTSLGHQAVIVFFALSGYWVGGAAMRAVRRDPPSLGHYARARLTRLWLVLVPAIALTELLDRVGAAIRPDSDVYQGSSAYHTVVPVGGPLPSLDAVDALGNAVFLQRLYVPALGTNSPLWSLMAEFWYYLLFPAALLVLKRGASWRVRVAAVLTLAAGIAVVSFPTEPRAPGVLALFPAWLLGAAVAWRRDAIAEVLDRIGGPVLASVRAILVVTVLACAAVDTTRGTRATTLALALATAAMVASFITDIRSPRARRIVAPVATWAEWSYSLYATHMPVVALLAALIVPLASDRWALTPVTYLGLLGITLVPVAVALGFYQLFERHTDRVRQLVTPKGSRRDARREEAPAVASGEQ